jgi:VWFA-related protein
MIVSQSSVLLVLIGSLNAGRPQDLQTANIRGILIEMDSGNLVAKASDLPRIHGELHYATPEGGRQLDLATMSKPEGSTLVIRVPSGAPTPIQFSLELPKSIAVTIVGHSLSIRTEGFESSLTVRTFSGDIDVLNAIGPTSLDSDSGNINVGLRAQPKADFHVQTDSGRVTCTMDDGLSLKVLLRSGKRISWGTGAETTSGGLDRSLGKGGPLIYASSRINNVRVDLLPSELITAGSDSGVVFRSDTNWVYLNVIVKDLKGKTIPDLEQERFIVTDDGSPVELGHFEKTTEPFHLLLLFDVSASIEPHVGLIRAAATRFIERARKGDEIAIATFSSSVRLIQPFTPDLVKAKKALEAIKPAGGTAIYDAVHMAVTDYMKEATGRKAVVLFTDGIDNSLFGRDFGSSHSFETLLRTVKDSDCLIYPIFVQPVPEKRQLTSDPSAPSTSLTEQRARASGPNPQLYCGSETNRAQTAVPCDGYQIIAMGKKHLQQLAEETGGAFRGLNDMTNLADAYSQIAADLTTVYTIGFSVKFIDTNRWHPLKVRIREAPIGTQTRTRSGYFSPPAKQ